MANTISAQTAPQTTAEYEAKSLLLRKGDYHVSSRRLLGIVRGGLRRVSLLRLFLLSAVDLS